MTSIIKIIRYPLLLILYLISNTVSSQVKPSVIIGTGIVSYGGLRGIGSENEIILPANPFISYGLSVGFAMSSDEKIKRSESGSFNQNAIFFGDINLYFNPIITKKFEAVIFGGGGIRHQNSTQLLVNSSMELSTSNVYATGIGFKGGVGLNYHISSNYLIGLKYKHDFYKNGFDYVGINFGIQLN